VIETTGLADPAPIAQTLLIDPMLRHQVHLANIVTTVDGMHGAAQLHSHPESLRQAAIADRLVITKSDLVAPALVRQFRQDLMRLNPTARIFDVQSDQFDANALLTEGVADPATKLAEVRHWLQMTGGDEHEEDIPHDHAHHLGDAHSPDIKSCSLRIEDDIDWTAFGVWLTALLHKHGTKVLRVKGLLNVADADGPVVIHGVQHVIHPPVHLEEWPDEDRASRIVFVVQGIEPELLRRSLFTFLLAANGGRSSHHRTAATA
jgi:G3E family GTPase